MDKFSLFAAQLLTFRECFSKKGHSACAGCGVALAVRHVYKALNENDKTLEKARWQIPWKQSSIFKTTDQPSGQALPALLSVPKENDNILNICFDNECTESRIKNNSLIKKLPAIAASSDYAYTATACPSHPFDLFEKVNKGWEADGHAYIHILCPCPAGWGFEPQETVRLGRMAVETRLFPLYEISSGYYQVTTDETNPRPLKDYIKKQDRFSSWKSKQIESLQEEADVFFHKLKEKTKTGI